MNDQIKLIAERLKDLREIAGISVETVSKEMGIESELYESYESGSIDIPVGFLFKIAQKFKIELTVLLGGDDPKLHMYCVTRKDNGLQIERRKQYKYESLAHSFVNKKAEPFIVTIEPTNETVPGEFNSHPGQELNYVLEGSVKVFIGEHEIILNVGDSVYFDSGCKHAMIALNNKRVKFLAVII
jgi:transcriptional regulator with XRE-family HTH domain